jgi:type VI secretion system protein ImpB
VPYDICNELHVGPLPVPPLDRLMELRDALVALKGPLASEPALQECLRKRLFNEETDSRVLGERNTPLASVICSIPFG